MDFRKTVIVEARRREFFAPADLFKRLKKEGIRLPGLRLRLSEGTVYNLCNDEHGEVIPRDDEWMVFCGFLHHEHLQIAMQAAHEALSAEAGDSDPTPELMDVNVDASALLRGWHADGADGRTPDEIEGRIVETDRLIRALQDAKRDMLAAGRHIRLAHGVK